MKWLRRIAAAPLVLFAWICAIGMIRIFSKNLPDSSFGEGVFAAFFASASAAVAYFLLRPDLQNLRSLSASQIRGWAFTNPIGQAVLLYLAAAAIMLAAPKISLLPGFVAQCAFSVLAVWSAFRARRWWATAALAALSWILLFGALAGTAEALTPRGFGEAGMIFLLPMEGFPILLALSGIVRWIRRSPAESGS
ncbi:MAG TPA: hypothetical protein VJA66_02835 [Thermoanaerobaculia bacterium]